MPETVAAWTTDGQEAVAAGMAFCAPLTPGETERARAFVADAYHRDEFRTMPAASTFGKS